MRIERMCSPNPQAALDRHGRRSGTAIGATKRVAVPAHRNRDRWCVGDGLTCDDASDWRSRLPIALCPALLARSAISSRLNPARLAMIINGRLRDFSHKVITKGQITLGDVRRLQRGYPPGGITNREELEILISLNAKLVRADKAWPRWLVSVVADFVVTREACERPFEDAAGKWVEGLLAASATKLGLRIARQIRRELSRLRAIQSMHAGEGVQSSDVQQPRQIRAPECDSDKSLRNNRGAEPPRRYAAETPARSRPPRRSAAHDWCLATYVRNLQRSDLINFQGSRVSLVLAPCR